MTVLKGEGKFPILYGTTSVSAGPLTRTAYLARPDLAGEWPTIVLAVSAWGVTSAVKDLCRRLARRGLAAVAPDVHRGVRPPRNADREAVNAAYAALGDGSVTSDLQIVSSFVTNPAGFWSNAVEGFGLLGLGAGGEHALLAARAGVGDAVCIAYAPVDAAHAVTMPLLGLYGRDDSVVPVEAVLAFRDAVPHGEFVLYEGVGHDFLDDYGDDYAAAAASDALDRMTGFFLKQLPEGPG